MSNIALLLIFLLITFSTSTLPPSTLSMNCLTRQLPTKFAILTTTYIRSGSTKMIKDYLKRYAESDCDLYDNIYIVWNNQETPEEIGVLANKQKWKKNVYFMQTVQNSLDFKYIVPHWAKEKVFFSMDDDFDITCDTLRKGFNQWQKASYGQVGPLSSFYGRSYIFQPEEQSFTYIDQIKLNKNWNYYHFGLTGIAFISRHFLELYYADIFQIKQMRKQVVEKNNCQDLLLNFMISYLYPELVMEYLDLPFKSLGMTGVSATKKHKEYRAECITRFSQILGYNPCRYIRSKNNQTLMHRKTNINQNCLVNIKQQHYEKNFISNRAYYMYIKKITGVDNDFVRDENKRLIESKKNIENFMKKRKEQNEQENINLKLKKQDVHVIGDNERKMFENEEMEIHFGNLEQIQKYVKNMNIQLVQPQQKTKQPSVIENTSVPPLRQQQTQNNQEQKNNEVKTVQDQGTKQAQSSLALQTQASQQTSESFIALISQQQYIFYTVIFASIILSILCIKKIIDGRRNKYQTIPITNSNQM